MKCVRRCKVGPLVGFTILSLLGFVFFTTSVILVLIYPDYFNDFLDKRNIKSGLDDMTIFIVLSILNAFGFFVTFIHLLMVKPTSKKVLIPIVLVTLAAFAILIALDFYLEVKMAHVTPKEAYTRAEDDKPGKKGKARFKMGYLIIYVSLCIVAGFIYIAFKDLEEYLDRQKNENETNEIMISHIT